MFASYLALRERAAAFSGGTGELADWFRDTGIGGEAPKPELPEKFWRAWTAGRDGSAGAEGVSPAGEAVPAESAAASEAPSASEAPAVGEFSIPGDGVADDSSAASEGIIFVEFTADDKCAVT
jgi:hypothetical protein